MNNSVNKKEKRSNSNTNKKLIKRIIPCLDIKDGKVVKGLNFNNLQHIGDPIELASFYDENGADELIFLDIHATEEKRKTMADLAYHVSKQINIPFTVGGGISSIQEVEILLQCGADKVSINSSAIKRPELIRELSTQFGSHVIIVAIDAKKVDDEWMVFSTGGKVPTGLNLFNWAEKVKRLGAGEILFTSIDKDGTKKGFSNSALSKLSMKLDIPIIASGGAGTMEHFFSVFKEGKVDGALAASIFHNKEITIPKLKEFLHKKGIQVKF